MALTCGMISMIDDAVGELIQTLKNNGQYDNTVIVFTSDHGDYLVLGRKKSFINYIKMIY